MKISARNVLRGKVTTVTRSAVAAEVQVLLRHQLPPRAR